jgi:hypothetical protein
MKWDTLLRDVARKVYNNVLEGRLAMDQILIDLIESDYAAITDGGGANEIRKRYADKAYEVVMGWDVRSVGRLRDLFPYFFPENLQTGTLVASLEDAGWVVLAKPKVEAAKSDLEANDVPLLPENPKPCGGPRR